MVNFSYLEEENGKGEENKKRMLEGQSCGVWEASGKEKKEERENNFVLQIINLKIPMVKCVPEYKRKLVPIRVTLFFENQYIST